MAKKETKAATGNFRKHGWIVDDKYMKEYALVTENNRKSAIVVGRVLYIFFPDKGKFRYAGFMEVWPKLKRTWVKVSCHPILPTHKFYSSSDMTVEEYKEHFEPLLTKKIAQGVLYIRREEKLIRYDKSEKD